MVSFSNSAPNGKLATSMVIDVIFNEEARRRELGTVESESQALVSKGIRESGRGHHKGTGKGQRRSQSRDRTFTYFY